MLVSSTSTKSRDVRFGRPESGERSTKYTSKPIVRRFQRHSTPASDVIGPMYPGGGSTGVLGGGAINKSVRPTTSAGWIGPFGTPMAARTLASMYGSANVRGPAHPVTEESAGLGELPPASTFSCAHARPNGFGTELP